MQAFLNSRPTIVCSVASTSIASTSTTSGDTTVSIFLTSLFCALVTQLLTSSFHRCVPVFFITSMADDGCVTPRPLHTNRQAWKQTPPPSERYTIRHQVFYCKYLSCKICFNVLNYVGYFLLTFNFYRLANFNSFVTILAVVSYNTII